MASVRARAIAAAAVITWVLTAAAPGTAQDPPPPPLIASFGSTSAAVTVPEQTGLYASTTSTVYGTPYELAIISENGDALRVPGATAVLCKWNSPCETTAHTDWSYQTNPRPLRYYAVVRSRSDPSIIYDRSETVEIQVQPFDFDASISAAPSTVTVPGYTTLRAETNRSLYGTPYEVAVIAEVRDKYKQPGEASFYCSGRSSDTTSTVCQGDAHTDWFMQSNPPTLRYHAVIRAIGDRSVIVARSESVDVTVLPYDFQTTITADPISVLVPGYTTLRATTNLALYGVGYELAVIPEVRDKFKLPGDANFYCRGSSSDTTSTSCEGTAHTDWWMNESPTPLSYHAVVRSRGDRSIIVDRSPSIEVNVEPQYYSVSLAFAETVPGVWTATATATPPVYGSPYRIVIRNSGGQVVASCTPPSWAPDSCSATVGAGQYRATVESTTGLAFGQSSWWSLSDAGIEDDTVDGVSLIELAALFASPSAMCTPFLHWGTHVVYNSSVTDQYFFCEGAVAEGKSKVEILRGLAALVSGSAVLWYLHDYATQNGDLATDTVDGDEEPQEPLPVPPPPLMWPSELEQDADRLMLQNPERLTSSQARTVLKTCTRLATATQCLDRPIFVSGDIARVRAATNHDRRAIFRHGKPAMLTYAAKDQRAGSGWYEPVADTACGPQVAGTECDEYPFRSTVQGGPGASLERIDFTANRSQGGSLVGFYNACRVAYGEQFIVVPAPRGSNLPSMPVCNHGF